MLGEAEDEWQISHLNGKKLRGLLLSFRYVIFPSLAEGLASILNNKDEIKAIMTYFLF